MRRAFRIGDMVRVGTDTLRTYEVVGVDGRDYILETTHGARTVAQAEQLKRIPATKTKKEGGDAVLQRMP